MAATHLPYARADDAQSRAAVAGPTTARARVARRRSQLVAACAGDDGAPRKFTLCPGRRAVAALTRATTVAAVATVATMAAWRRRGGGRPVAESMLHDGENSEQCPRPVAVLVHLPWAKLGAFVAAQGTRRQGSRGGRGDVEAFMVAASRRQVGHGRRPRRRVRAVHAARRACRAPLPLRPASLISLLQRCLLATPAPSRKGARRAAAALSARALPVLSPPLSHSRVRARGGDGAGGRVCAGGAAQDAPARRPRPHPPAAAADSVGDGSGGGGANDDDDGWRDPRGRGGRRARSCAGRCAT